MKLSFHAKPGGCSPWPDSHHYGQPRRFIGRQYVAPATSADSASWPAKSNPDSIDSDAPDAAHLIRKCSKGELWAADEATAAACGVAFVKLEKGTDGEWFAAASKPKNSPKE